MNIYDKFNRELEGEPFGGYPEYMDYLFACVNSRMDQYLEEMKGLFASGQGGYKNVLYPDLEIAHTMCQEKIHLFSSEPVKDDEDEENGQEPAELSDELMALLGDYAAEMGTAASGESQSIREPDCEEMMTFIEARAEKTLEAGIALPFYSLCKKMEFEHFTTFCFACSILASTQTDYAGVFQVINENGSLPAPTIESAARLYYGNQFSITGAYGDMSVGLEQLQPILDLRVNGSMPFSTVVTPDKRIIDFLFGKRPMQLDENYIRFFKMLTDDKELDPIMANQGQLDAMEISYNEGVRIFSFFGDEGSGRKFFIKQFCKKNGMGAISVNCKKLFVYDFAFVEKALWAVTRECILTNSCCCLDELTFHEEEKDKFLGYMDLAFAKLVSKGLLVYALSKEKMPMRDITKEEFTELEIPTPTTQEREECWRLFAKDYALGDDIDLLEMATKFLFTPGKIKAALANARSLATMNKDILIPRATLFQGCNNQMSSELTQKATKVKANFGFEDIVMNRDQRETLEHAIDQMNFRKQVYDNWHYTKKYPYGRGLSVLLFGAPGTGKSMCAQVIAHELNLELYRVDLSKVIDKYVGETEKSISMIFREAKKCNVVLFFDECDTLFAKRSDDGGSNQASNNNKTALLLQEVEAYDGVSVLATNYKHNIDPAFFRRMKYIVEFQFPNADTREMLWRTTIPKDTPLAEDVDIRFLAEKFEFAGGNIKNCILNAAFLAAADGDGKEVRMKHYLQAIRYEYVKTGKVFTRSDFEPYAEEVFGMELG